MKQLTALVALAGALTGCGPVRTTAHIIDAEVDIGAARSVGAEKRAAYEWTAANLYLHKAREEVAYSNYQSGVEFATKASDCAKAARMKSTNQSDKAAVEAQQKCEPKPPEAAPKSVQNPGGS